MFLVKFCLDQFWIFYFKDYPVEPDVWGDEDQVGEQRDRVEAGGWGQDEPRDADQRNGGHA